MAIDINIPSQVKNYANLAAFPATGTLKTIFIAEDTNKTYRWTGSVYVEISGTDTSSLVPTSRTLTINGTTQDLSADRTFTISTGITIGTTAITSGTVGRVLFEGTGNVVQESANLFWDNTNGRLGIGTSTPSRPLHVVGTSLFNNLIFNDTSALTIHTNIELKSDNAYETGLLFRSTSGFRWQLYADNYTSNNLKFYNYKLGSQAMMIGGGTNNVLINTTTDAGYKLDVNGTARIINQATFGATGTDGSVRFLRSADGANVGYIQVNSSGLQVGNGTYAFFHNNSLNGINVGSNPLAMWHIKGLGATSATTSLLVQQSTGVDILKVTNDMYVTVQNTNNAECFQVRGANDDATIRFTPSGGTSNIVLRSQASSITLSTTANSFGDLRVSAQGQTLRIGTSLSSAGGGVNYYSSQNGSIHSHRWFHNNAEQMSLQYTGNLLIGTTTDAGYKLDVNGTARVVAPNGFSMVYASDGALNLNGLYSRFDLLNATGSLRARIINDGPSGALTLYQNATGYIYLNGASSGHNSYIATALSIGNTSSANASSILELTSTTKGFLPPRMTTTQKNAIASPVAGLMVYDTTLNVISFYNGTIWL